MSRTVHVLPADDLIGHEESNDCVCGPDVDIIAGTDHQPAWIVTHHPLDGREQREADTDADQPQ